MAAFRLFFQLLLLSAALPAFALIRRNHIGTLNYGLKIRDHGLLSSPADVIPEQWFEQTVDHFDLTKTATWKQRYFVNDTCWKKNGAPIFLVLGGEGPISPAYVGNHFSTGELAEEFNAMVIGLEHRFYGSSFPTNDSSTSSLRLLSSQQALADAANFQRFITKQYGASNSKWVVFGGSYSGSLSAWLKNRYPELFVGSIASSAPVNAVEDFTQYFEVVEAAVGSACARRLKDASSAVDVLLQSANGKARVQTVFNTCTPLVSDRDISVFWETITDPIAEVVQYNHDNRGHEAMDIQGMCNILMNGEDPIAAWAAFIASRTDSDCVESSYKSYIEGLMPTSAGRSWTFQTCTEYGYFQTGESERQPFSPHISLQFFRDICRDAFGQDMPVSPNTEWTNTYYGGLNLRSTAINTFFGDGTTDPWHALAIVPSSGPGFEALNSNSAAALITGTAHCADLYASSPNDLPELTKVRATQREYIRTWLGQGASVVIA